MWIAGLSLKRCLGSPKVIHTKAAPESAVWITFGSSDGTLDVVCRGNADGRFQVVGAQLLLGWSCWSRCSAISVAPGARRRQDAQRSLLRSMLRRAGTFRCCNAHVICLTDPHARSGDPDATPPASTEPSGEAFSGHSKGAIPQVRTGALVTNPSAIETRARPAGRDARQGGESRALQPCGLSAATAPQDERGRCASRRWNGQVLAVCLRSASQSGRCSMAMSERNGRVP